MRQRVSTCLPFPHTAYEAPMLLLMATSTFLAAMPGIATAQSTPEANPFRELVETYVEAWNSHDPIAVGQFFAEDADLVLGNLPAAQGRASIQSWWRDYFNELEPERRATVDVTSARSLTPDVAVIDVAMTTSGPALPLRKARETWLLRRASGGEWLISAMRSLPTESDRVELRASLEVSQSVRPQIRAFVAAYEDIFNRHDPDALSSFYRDDADIIVRERPAIRGAQAIQEWWHAYFDQARDYRALLIIEEIRMLDDDVALLNVIGTGAALEAAEELAPTRQARATWVLLREDGEWRIAVLRVLPSEDDRIIRESDH